MIRGFIIDGLIGLSLICMAASRFLLNQARRLVARNIQKHSDGEKR